jgi:DNA-binding HxlR family transcriptional regulator
MRTLCRHSQERTFGVSSMLRITVTSDEESKLCPVRNVLASVTGKWSSLIILSLSDGALRFSAIRRVVGDITPRVLTENLRTLERDGHVMRRVHPGPPVEVSYALTENGEALLTLLEPLALWAEERFAQVIEARVRFDAAAG